ncbi:N-acetylglucosamine-6-phosphate deacetylase [Bacillus sp. B15-48]|uniref:N-acetylglucosamine-6-phosphate deacetylase n=1 Tax=Bacillus sp. B15-48 TaxID=1548601 RepID=UPI00193ED987|nr:N-acetylglucosamine-6-phosphate deacetylase [Bacillus sp. B15-48]MBM4761397.1 N-acetylglucosamine-6-phosphate deacetylase [Bacillus sp. B15-48]
MNHKSKPILLTGMQLYAEDQILATGYLQLKDEKIIGYGSIENLPSTEGFEVIEVPSTFKAIPGLIDIHIHGVNGADVMDATTDALATMAIALPKEGTTSFLATTMTQSTTAIEKALINAGNYIKQQQLPGKAEVLGVHLEGPFVNKVRAGAQPVDFIIDSSIEKFKKWNSLAKQSVKIVTLAPEQPGGLELVNYLIENDIIASIGHSDATYHEVVKAIEAGANHVTHLFNQMRPLHHRDPGVVGAAFLHDKLLAEIIADGIHVQPEMVKLAFQNKDEKGLILITDSMRAKCLKNGVYDLGGQEVTVADGKALLEDGTLAGSILKLGHALKNMMNFTGCSLEAAIKMASVTPARQLNVFDRKGSIALGKDADIVILDQQLNVAMTFCRGKLAYNQGGEQQ